jgi:hypothetical protein
MNLVRNPLHGPSELAPLALTTQQLLPETLRSVVRATARDNVLDHGCCFSKNACCACERRASFEREPGVGDSRTHEKRRTCGRTCGSG